MSMRIDAVDPNLLQANIDMLQQQFGQRPMVPLQEVARYLHKDPRTLKAERTFPIKRICGSYVVPLTALAGWMS